jgi:hypothetical protein
VSGAVLNLVRFCVGMNKETEKQQGPDTHMHHDIGSIKYIIPIGDMLDVDEVNDTAIDQPIKNITAATADYKSKADIFMPLHILAKP